MIALMLERYHWTLLGECDTAIREEFRYKFSEKYGISFFEFIYIRCSQFTQQFMLNFTLSVNN